VANAVGLLLGRALGVWGAMLTKNRVAKLTAVRRMDIFIEDVPEPTDEEMLIQVAAAGICGSDLHYFRHGGLGSFKQPLPMRMGHEPAGIVVDPNGHTEFAVGDRVAIEPGRPCLTSPWSLRGRHNLCKEGSFMGAQGQPGCFSDFVCVTPFQCCKLPETISFEGAALLEPIAVALHAVSLVEAKFTDVVAIYGGGTIGLCCYLILRRHGIQMIYIVDRVKDRRDFAHSFGATDAFPFEDAVARLRERTGGKGCSLVLDTAGDDASFEACLQCAAVGARIGLLAIPEADHLAYNPHQARTKEVRIINVHRSTLLLREAVGLFSDVSASEKLERLVTHRMPLADVGAAFDMASGYMKGVIKIMLQPGFPAPRKIQRIGLIGLGVHSLPSFLDRLLADCSVEVVCAAVVQGEQEEESEKCAFERECRHRSIPFLGALDLTGVASQLRELACDLLFAGMVAARRSGAALRGAAREGLITTHLGLLPANDDPEPALWATLRGLPQGATTRLQVAKSDSGGQEDEEQAVDIFVLEEAASGSSSPCRRSARVANELLQAEVEKRLPMWLGALRTGVFDMSAMRALRLANSHSLAEEDTGRRHCSAGADCEAPNNSYVSWGWRCSFLERFSDALGRVRAVRENGSDLWFTVESASALPSLDAMLLPGNIVGADSSIGRFLVRAADGLVTCVAEDPASTPGAGMQLAASPPGPLPPGCLGIPSDFQGDVLGPRAAPLATVIGCPPPPLPHAVPRPAGPFAGIVAAGAGAAGDTSEGSQASFHPQSRAAARDAVSSAPPAHPAASSQASPPGSSGVQIFDLKFEEDFVAEFQANAAEVLTSGRPLSESKFCRAFESAFAELVHAPHALVTSSGTMALNIAFRAVGVRGKAVIAPSNTFFATQVAVENAGAARCLSVDCEPEFMQVCPKALERLMSAQPAGSVAAVVLVHVGGIIAPFAGKIREIARAYGAALVEDAAHAHTSYLDGVGWAGTIGDIAAFSFFPTKVMTMGEGGVITTQSEGLYEACRQIKAFGSDLSGGASRFTCVRPDGTNGRVPELSALLGFLECRRVQQRVAQRQALVAAYVRGLEGCSAYHVLQQPGGSCSYYKCIVRLHGIDRDALRAFAKERGISFTGEVYHCGVHRMSAFTGATVTNGDAPTGGLSEGQLELPGTDEACATHACPPLYPELTEADVLRVCAVMREAATQLCGGSGDEDGKFAATAIVNAATVELPCSGAARG